MASLGRPLRVAEVVAEAGDVSEVAVEAGVAVETGDFQGSLLKRS